MNHLQAATIFASQTYRLKTVPIRQPALCIVLSGTKMIHLPSGDTVTLQPKQAILLAQHTVWDITNQPDRDHSYQAVFVGFDATCLQDAARSSMHLTTQPIALLQKLDHASALLEATQRLLPKQTDHTSAHAKSTKTSTKISPEVFRHRQLEILLLIAEAGYHFPHTTQTDWLDAIRHLVQSAPHQDWQAANLAKSLNLSESSLRRRLQNHPLTLATIVREIRLEHALHLLQTTLMPIGEVAQACGWESHSQFSAAFQKRWGAAPSSVRAS
ncbi:AraC family transcriptional regulator [Parvibium lacunae]|nr:AraC family transcriptional regulator [Parvibium lacunae]